MRSMMDLNQKISKLKNLEEKFSDSFNSIFEVDCSTGTMRIPPSFESKICDYFGEKDKKGQLIEDKVKILERIKNQKIVKIFNKWTNQGALFNSLRTERPGMKNKNEQAARNKLKILIRESEINCDFCQANIYTPEDTFGRIEGKHSITAANVAKYDAWSSLVIFRNHDPLKFNLIEFSDYLDTGFNWFKKVFQEDESYKFPFFVWNCLYKAGASQIHGHAQILMSKDYPYARVEHFKKASLKYQEQTGRDYYHDWYQLHSALGLAFSTGEFRVVASLTPTKEKEIIILSTSSPVENQVLKNIIYNTLRCFIDVMGVQSFNLSISCPAIEQEDDTPYVINLVDRGNLFRPTVDMGGMELFGSTVVADDPFKIIEILKRYLNSS